nr:hypothetical protein [Agrobacterium sp.]
MNGHLNSPDPSTCRSTDPGPVGDFELLLCHGTVCVVGKMRDLILQLSKSSIYSTKPPSRQVSVMLCQCYNQLTNSD